MISINNPCLNNFWAAVLKSPNFGRLKWQLLFATARKTWLPESCLQWVYRGMLQTYQDNNAFKSILPNSVKLKIGLTTKFIWYVHALSLSFPNNTMKSTSSNPFTKFQSQCPNRIQWLARDNVATCLDLLSYIPCSASPCTESASIPAKSCFPLKATFPLLAPERSPAAFSNERT